MNILPRLVAAALFISILAIAAFLYAGGMDSTSNPNFAEGIQASQSLEVDTHSPIGLIGQPASVTFSTTKPGCSTTVTVINKTMSPLFIGLDIRGTTHITVQRNFPPNSMTPIEVIGDFQHISAALAGLKGVWTDEHPPAACQGSARPLTYQIGEPQNTPF